ncbi:hypothetical protein [Verrucosispora sp. NA02020]|uniref:hypothetical protein n=1 Tax=Verrucosispora sp. NA02020 TaxID=2742132 RepID=UPI003D7282B3
MSACPHCGKDTSTEPKAPDGTLAAGGQLYRTRRGARIEPAERRPDNAGSDAA